MDCRVKPGNDEKTDQPNSILFKARFRPRSLILIKPRAIAMRDRAGLARAAPGAMGVLRA